MAEAALLEARGNMVERLKNTDLIAAPTIDLMEKVRTCGATVALSGADTRTAGFPHESVEDSEEGLDDLLIKVCPDLK